MSPRRQPKSPGSLHWRLLVYRVPTEPASKRVSVWRDLKKIGALYLQQCVCIVPDLPAVVDQVSHVAARIPAIGGETILFEVPNIQPEDQARIIAAFREQRSNEYAEIVEECETKFVKEIEFEHFRQNYTFAEAEEIEQDLDKIRRWFDQVQARDWFGADRREEVQAWLGRCQNLLADFEAEVYRRNPNDEGDDQPLADEPAPPPLPRAITPLRPIRKRRPRSTSRLRQSGTNQQGA